MRIPPRAGGWRDGHIALRHRRTAAWRKSSLSCCKFGGDTTPVTAEVDIAGRVLHYIYDGDGTIQTEKRLFPLAVSFAFDGKDFAAEPQVGCARTQKFKIKQGSQISEYEVELACKAVKLPTSSHILDIRLTVKGEVTVVFTYSIQAFLLHTRTGRTIAIARMAEQGIDETTK